MQYSDVMLTQDDEKNRVFGKGQRERTVMLTAAPQSIRLLRRHFKQSHITASSVFRGDPRYGGSPLPLDYTVVQKAWQKYCRAAGVEATIHQLRHSRATQLIAAGVPVTTVRKQMCHRMQSTLRYAEVDQATMKHDLLEYQRRKGKTRNHGKWNRERTRSSHLCNSPSYKRVSCTGGCEHLCSWLLMLSPLFLCLESEHFFYFSELRRRHRSSRTGLIMF